jgi:hypothetical protein
MNKTLTRAKQRKGRAEAALLAASIEQNSWNFSIVLYGIGLAAIVVALYWRVLGNQFINFDDEIYVTANDHVKAGLTLDGFRWAFTNLVNYWHPLTWLSHMLDIQLFGLNADGHHFTSVLWHAVNSAVLLVALWYMTGCLWRSAFVAAMFALHPLRVESVAWVSERKDVLSSFFYFCTLWAYAWYTRRPQSLRRYMTVAALLLLGLMAKPSVVSLPFLLLLLDYWPLRRKEPLAILVREKILFFTMAAANRRGYLLFAEASGRNGEHRRPFIRGSAGERIGFLCALPGEDFLAASPSGHLSVLQRFAGSVHCSRLSIAFGYHCFGFVSGPSVPLSAGSLVLVSRCHGSHGWIRTGWPASLR